MIHFQKFIQRINMEFKIFSTFTGAGGLDIGFHGDFNYLGKYYPKLNFETVKALEINRQACDTLKNNKKYFGKTEIINKDITKILVTDYYSQKVIDAKEAFFVIGSDLLGPMGNELIPFAQESDAKTFSNDHNGKKIVKFDKIVEKEVLKLDE